MAMHGAIRCSKCFNSTAEEHAVSLELLQMGYGTWYSSKMVGIRDDEAWYDNLEKLKQFKQKNGHSRVPRAQPQLGVWVSNQRQRQNTIPKHRMDAIDAIGFCWSRDEAWETMYAELKKFQERHGHCRVPIAGKLGKWVARQRFFHSEGKLNEERFQKLHGIGFAWTLRETASDPLGGESLAMFANLQKFQEKHGPCKVPFSEGKLGSWVSTQRGLFNRGKLNEERFQKLQELRFTWVLCGNSSSCVAQPRQGTRSQTSRMGGAAGKKGIMAFDLGDDEDDDDEDRDDMESIKEKQQEADDEQPSDEEMSSKPQAMKLKRATKCQRHKLQWYSRKLKATPKKNASTEKDDTESITEDKASRRRTAELGMESEKEEEGEQSIEMEVSCDEDNDDTSSDIEGDIEEEASIGIPRRAKGSQLQKLRKLVAAQETIIKNQIERLHYKRTIIRSQRRAIRKQKRIINMRQKFIQKMPIKMAVLQQQVETIQQELADLQGSGLDL
ncbi:helicase [Seminavis robusta]|uniref:Helicase n=1 Tax=Seminavis robusta TaxID=568900 RepID=A0A9N8F447_9STRA|nr:helicase [Seminavis robusta]|eukprot:Sro2801_g337390.1 helicase (499) ;mRNA; f:3586-5082